MTNPKILQNVRLIQKCLIVRGDGRLLALKRVDSDKSRPGCWDTPGGGYEQGENAFEAIKREVLEEAGLKLNSAMAIFFDNKIGEEIGFWSGETVFGVCYVSRDWEGEVKLSEEHAEYKWVSIEEFPTYEFGQDGGFFRDALHAYMTLPH